MSKIPLLKIMVIDDEEMVLENFNDLFSRSYFKIFKARNGQAAVDEMQRNKYDIAFIDVYMPVMDGLETLSKLKEINPQLMAVMISGYKNEKVLEESLKLGAEHYLYKPLDIQNIIGVTVKCARYLGIENNLEII